MFQGFVFDCMQIYNFIIFMLRLNIKLPNQAKGCFLACFNCPGKHEYILTKCQGLTSKSKLHGSNCKYRSTVTQD